MRNAKNTESAIRTMARAFLAANPSGDRLQGIRIASLVGALSTNCGDSVIRDLLAVAARGAQEAA